MLFLYQGMIELNFLVSDIQLVHEILQHDICVNLLFLFFFWIPGDMKVVLIDKIFIMAALAKAQQLLLDPQEREYILSQVNAAKGNYMNDYRFASFVFTCYGLFSQLMFWHPFFDFISGWHMFLSIILHDFWLINHFSLL